MLHTYQNSIHGFALRASDRGIANMQRANPFISYCVQDEVVSLAPPPGRRPGNGGGGGGGADPQETPWGITRVGGAVDGSGLTRRAWVLDSGIDLDHPDLNVDTGRSRDFTGSRKGAEDENGHGTHVAGTIAAIDNSIGVVGVAAGAPVVAVRVLNRRGSGSYSGIIAGVDLLPPDMDNVDTLDRIIYEELMLGKATKDAQRAVRSMFINLQKEGAQAVILACTELQLIVDVDANVMPIYDCTGIHADAAARWIIGDE